MKPTSEFQMLKQAYETIEPRDILKMTPGNNFDRVVKEVESNRLRFYLEDMGTASRLKNHLKNQQKEFLETKTTYTKIMDPITQPDDSDFFNKKLDLQTNDLIYANNDNGTSIVFNQRHLNEICTKFFQAVFKENKIKLMELNLIDFKKFKPGRPDLNAYSCVIKLNADVTISHYFHIGSFGVKLINNFIHFYIEKRYTQGDVMNVLNDAKEIKLTKTLISFYEKLILHFEEDEAIIFIQMFKSFGDHSQLHEFKHIYESVKLVPNSPNRVIFGTKDRILVSEALHWKCPIIFTLKSDLSLDGVANADDEAIDTDVANDSNDFVYIYPGEYSYVPITGEYVVQSLESKCHVAFKLTPEARYTIISSPVGTKFSAMLLDETNYVANMFLGSFNAEFQIPMYLDETENTYAILEAFDYISAFVRQINITLKVDNLNNDLSLSPIRRVSRKGEGKTQEMRDTFSSRLMAIQKTLRIDYIDKIKNGHSARKFSTFEKNIRTRENELKYQESIASKIFENVKETFSRRKNKYIQALFDGDALSFEKIGEAFDIENGFFKIINQMRGDFRIFRERIARMQME